MRVAIGETPNAENYRAYLNGVFVELCIEANDTAGYVVAYKRDAPGHWIRDEHGNFVTETLWGLVTIEVPE